MATNEHPRSLSVREGRRFWCVSPNVNNDRLATEWKRLVLLKHAAFMGYRPDGHTIGRRFVEEIRKGDMILIARQHKTEPDFVAFGVVQGDKAETRMRHVPPEDGNLGSLWRLKPFHTRRPPVGPLASVLRRHKMSLVEIVPDRSPDHRKLCAWMERQLRRKRHHVIQRHRPADPGMRQGADNDISLHLFIDRGKREYRRHTRSTIQNALKTEWTLLQDYKRWLRRQDRHLKVGRYGRLQSDAYEEANKNLIEAKSSIKREYVRMGVGQLLDYSYQGRRKFGRPNMALLLPVRPRAWSIKWLKPLKISVVWREGRIFRDNAKGRFSGGDQSI